MWDLNISPCFINSVPEEIWKKDNSGSVLWGLQPLLPKEAVDCKWAAVHCGSYSMQIDYPRQRWSLRNGWPLLTWSQAAYKWTIYKQSAGGRSTADRYLMETSSACYRLRGERQMESRPAIKHWRNTQTRRARHIWGTPKADKSIRWINTGMLAAVQWFADLTVNTSLTAEPTSQGMRRDQKCDFWMWRSSGSTHAEP